MRVPGVISNFGTAAPKNTGSAVGNVVLLEDIGGGTAGLPAVDGSQLTGLAGLPRSYLAGLALSNNGTDATNDIDIAVGTCRSADDTTDLTVSSAIGKQIDVSWAAGGTPGSPTGGLSSSLTITNDTWYHVHAILVSGTVEVGFDTSVTAANLIADHSATKYRRLGSVRRGTATNVAFTQFGDEFWWDVPVADLTNGAIATAGTTLTLTVPTGAVMIAVFGASEGTNSSVLNFYPPQVTGAQPAITTVPIGFVGGSVSDAHAMVRCPTNTSAQIIGRNSTATSDNSISTYGWVDRRGRDD